MIGKRVGRYQIEREIGRGGMGVVYRATQVTLNRTVAVKMLPEELAKSAEYLSRFRREAETLARLQHPNIVHIYDVEEAEGSHFIIMEYVEGGSLADLLRREGRLSPARAGEVVHGLANALTAAHRKGIIHRDIKPDNVLFNEEGRPKLTDFGIAYRRDANVRTQAGVMLGTPYYMSPEQAGGKPVTAASDIYALGVVLYEMLSGRVPFDADTPVAVALMHLKDAPPPLGPIAPDVPADLVEVVERSLAKDAGARFKSGSEFQRALGALDLPRTVGRSAAGSVSGRRAGEGACAGCGTALDPEFLACPSCGLAVRESCSSCGQIFRTDRAACPTCQTPKTVIAGASGARTESGGSAARSTDGRDTGGGGLKAAGKAAASAAAGLALKSADAVDRARAAAGRAAHDLSDSSDGSVLTALRARLPGRLATLPVPMLAGGGLAAIALVFVLFQLFGGLDDGLAADPEPVSTFAAGSPGTTPGRSTSVVSGSQVAGDGAATGGSSATDPVGSPGALPPAEDPADAGTPSEADGATPAVGQDELPDLEPDDTPAGSPERTPAAAARARDEFVPFDEVDARGDILAIVERQRLATEAGDLNLFLSDIAPKLRPEQRRSFLETHEVVDAVRNRVAEVTIDFEDEATATVELRVTLDVRLPGDSEWINAFDDWVIWEISRVNGTWMITDVE